MIDEGSSNRFAAAVDFGLPIWRFVNDVDRGALLRQAIIVDGKWQRGFFARADLLLSTSAEEGFGLAILEAMASGVPVAATAVGRSATDPISRTP